MDRNIEGEELLASICVAPRRGAWIEISLPKLMLADMASRTPQGCVDRNSFSVITKRMLVVAPRRGAWIEIVATSH